MTPSVFFLLSQLVSLALKGETWLAAGLVATVAGGLSGRRRLATGAGVVTLVAFLTIGLFPVGELILRGQEGAFPPVSAPDSLDGIVVLGGVEDPRATAFWGQPQINDAAERLTAAAALALAHPQARLVFSGGSGRLSTGLFTDPPLPGVALDFFTALGIDPARVTWESRSRNTAENARFAYEESAPQPGETWLLVTSAFHMGRALASFSAVGWDTIRPYPVDFRTGEFRTGISWNLPRNLGRLNVALNEAVGRLAYRLLGR
ncbi:YdcF family protein [Pararhodobacter zhoushanensis]|uniref:YdcF family protein n=1 Tax=Pararhodobacter zhoushanensis TaxID=2479545 RepID=UPI0013DF7B0D|nr:YdcF family protein [Pararhodobacter zhoushanensis]